MLQIKKLHFPLIDSTITTAKEELFHLNPDEITLVSAGEQRAGQGRWRSTWYSPPDLNIYATYCFTVNPRGRYLGNLAQALAISAATLLEKYQLTPTLKWPNDLLVNGKKIGGVVCELVSHEDALWALDSIGLNVNMTPEIQKKFNRPITSLSIETGKTWDLQEVWEQLNQQFRQDLSQLLQSGFSPLFPRLQRYVSPLIGQLIRFRGTEGEWKGVFHSLNDDGSLNLLLENGQLRSFFAGTID
jgi:BirA family biotin operon repressor/biotin-[acetyl-CoA-carboxylase] ligase